MSVFSLDSVLALELSETSSEEPDSESMSEPDLDADPSDEVDVSDSLDPPLLGSLPFSRAVSIESSCSERLN